MSSDWKTLESRVVYKNPWLKLHEDKVRTPSGETMLYSWYESADVVVVVPFLDDSTLVMINQYRYPLHKALLEFPAGHIENGENPQDTAVRELAEETGYHSKGIEHVYTYHPSVSKTRQVVYVYKAKELTTEEGRVGSLRHDSTEDIKVEKVKVKELAQMITDKKIENAGTLIAYLICCVGMSSSFESPPGPDTCAEKEAK
jgi:ADP-ribose pyrophosphatase